MRYTVQPMQVPIKLSRHVVMDWQVLDGQKPLALFANENRARAYAKRLNETDPLRRASNG